ncbi:MAG: hypothetical protein COA39_006625 [Sulfurimonas sp.]|nr:hypothetical protein [Sulfurimonas sp.]
MKNKLNSFLLLSSFLLITGCNPNSIFSGSGDDGDNEPSACFDENGCSARTKSSCENLLSAGGVDTVDWNSGMTCDEYFDAQSSTSSNNPSTGTDGFDFSLTCKAYSSGLCAAYLFNKKDDRDSYKNTCDSTPSCTTSGLIGICEVDEDNVRKSDGRVKSDLYIYDSIVGSFSEGKDKCENVYNGTFR